MAVTMAVIPSKRAFRGGRVRSGSSCTWVIMGSSRSRDGSGSSGTRSVDVRVAGSCTHSLLDLMDPRAPGVVVLVEIHIGCS